MEERYKLILNDDEWRIYDKNYHMNLEEVMDRLNEQDEEIKALKKIITIINEKPEREQKELSFSEFIKKYQGLKTDEVIAYELYLIIQNIKNNTKTNIKIPGGRI